MDRETVALADKYLQDAGYDPDLVRGRKSRVDVQRESDQRRREQWRTRNSLKAPIERQIGLAAPASKEKVKRLCPGAFIAGFILGRWL